MYHMEVHKQAWYQCANGLSIWTFSFPRMKIGGCLLWILHSENQYAMEASLYESLLTKIFPGNAQKQTNTG